MSKGMVDRLRELREAKIARNIERTKVEVGIRKAAAAGKEVLERSVKEAAERIKNKWKKAKKK